MTDPVTYRSAIVTTLATKVQGFVTVAAARGSLDSEELERLGKRLPACLLTLTDITDVSNEGGAVTCTCAWALFVLTKEQAQLTRDTGALVFVGNILQVLPFEDFGIQDASTVMNIECTNLYSTALDERGAALWLIRFEQRITLDSKLDPGDLDDFKKSAPDYYHFPMGQDPDFQDETDIPP